MIGKKQTWRIDKAVGMVPEDQGEQPNVPVWLYGLMPDRVSGNSFKPTQRVRIVANALSNSISPGRIQSGSLGYQVEFAVSVPEGQFNHGLAVTNGMVGHKGNQQVAGFYVDGRGVLGWAPYDLVNPLESKLRLQEPSTTYSELTDYTIGFGSVGGGNINATGIQFVVVSESRGVVTALDSSLFVSVPYVNQIINLTPRPPIRPYSVQRVYMLVGTATTLKWYLVAEDANNGAVRLAMPQLNVSQVSPTQEVGQPHVIFSNVLHGGRRFGLSHQVSAFPYSGTLGPDKYTPGATSSGLYFSDPGSQMSEGVNYIEFAEPLNEIVVYQEGLLVFGDTKIWYVTGDFSSSVSYLVRELPFAYQYGNGPNTATQKGPFVTKVAGKVFAVANNSVVSVDMGGLQPIGLAMTEGIAGDAGWHPVGIASWDGGHWLVVVYQQTSANPLAWVVAYDTISGNWFALDLHNAHPQDDLQVIGAVDRYQRGSFAIVRLGVDAYLYGMPQAGYGLAIESSAPRQVSYRSDLGAPRMVKLLKEITVRVPFRGFVDTVNTYVEVRITTEDGGTGGGYTTHKMNYWNNGYWRITPNVKSGIRFRLDFLIYGAVFGEGTDLSDPNASRFDMPIEISFIPVREYR